MYAYINIYTSINLPYIHMEEGKCQNLEFPDSSSLKFPCVLKYNLKNMNIFCLYRPHFLLFVIFSSYLKFIKGLRNVNCIVHWT